MQTLNNSLVNSFDNNVDELHRHYPWFTREEIIEIVERFGNRFERVLAYLDMKSGHWSYLDLID